jgi:hypothetical protein
MKNSSKGTHFFFFFFFLLSKMVEGFEREREKEWKFIERERVIQ